MPNDDTFSLKLQRLVGQIKFRPTLDSFNGVPNIAKELENDYDEWRAPKNSDVTLYTPSQKKFIQLNSDFITYVNEGSLIVNESEATIIELKEHFEKLYAKFVADCSIEIINRVGFRNTIIIETDFEYQDLVNLIYGKFYSTNELIKNISSEEQKDVAFILDSMKNDFLNHIQIGPVTKEQALMHFNSKFDVDIDHIAKNGVFIDLDVFVKDGLTGDNVLSKFNGAIDENFRIINAYIDYLSS